MDTRRALVVDAFTEEPLAGNGAGVVPDADDLGDGQMRAIARELGQNETAFLCASTEADRRLRYFTPAGEIDLCGHATVAAHAHLREAGAIDAGTHSLETAAGVLEVTVEEDGRIWMTQADPTVETVGIDRERIADALGVGVDAVADIDAELPLARASTGVPTLIAPLAYLEPLGNADPDPAAVETLTDATDADALYAFTFDTLEGASTLHGRLFAPALGIPEDPVTGTASGAVAAYLRRFGAFDPVPEELRFEQGDFVDRPGRVSVRPDEEIRVGGRAVTAVDGTIAVPDAADDEIIEA